MGPMRYFSFSAVLFLSTLLPTNASGEPVVTGTFGVERMGGMIWGGGFATNGSIEIGVSNFGGFHADCAPCAVGWRVSFSGMFTRDLAGVILSSPSFTLPEVEPGELLTVQMPFQFDAFGPGGDLSGTGTVTGHFSAYSMPHERGPFYMFQHAVYVAGAEPAVTPEPSSILLLATGVSALWARQRRRGPSFRSSRAPCCQC